MEREILIIDDDESIAWVVKKALEPLGYRVVSHARLSSGLKAVRDGTDQVVLQDLVLPDGSGLDALREIRASNRDATVIMVTAHGKMETTIEAMREGAYDYLEKPFDIEELKVVVEKAFRDLAMRAELNQLRSAAADADEPMIIGRSGRMLRVFKDIGKVASRNITVLVTGESGTGKELVAKAIHYNSGRRDGPFVAINAASIPKDLLEAELFGWEKGAFTGARGRHPGKIGSASGGTLFLDEISELDLNLQAKLLRFLQDRHFSPLGSNRVMEADVRIIGATNRDLREAVAAGAFREDLYYRFNVVQIKLPPLRERREDLMPLAKHFLKECERRLGTGRKELSKEARETILRYEWPGNVRELENAIKRAAVLSSGALIERRDLFLDEASSCSIKEFLEDKLKRYLKEMANLDRPNLYGTVISEVEKAIIRIVLDETGGNQLRAARILGINRNTLRTKMRLYRIR